MLYTKHNYLNKNVHYLVSNEIIEYDLKSAGFSLIKQHNLLDERRIRYLESLDNKARHIQVGLYQAADKVFSRALTAKFVDARRLFFEANQLTDNDVLSIKRDAIFTTRRCMYTDFDALVFGEKSTYTSYYYLNQLEFYYNREGIDVKGIADDKLESHREYMLDFFMNFFRMQEISKPKIVVNMISDFTQYYKEKKLHVGYYRELNKGSLYRFHEKYMRQNAGVPNLNDVGIVDIGYNYFNYLVPLISLLV